MDNLSAFTLTWFVNATLGLDFRGTNPTQLLLPTVYTYELPEEWIVSPDPAPASPVGFVLMQSDGEYRAGLYMLGSGCSAAMPWEKVSYDFVAPLDPLLDFKIIGIASCSHCVDYMATPRTVCYANGKSFRYPESRKATWVLLTQPLRYV